MRFSIVIPVYNVEEYLGECLQSVANQTFRDFEVILVNDGSTDLSAEICTDFIKKSLCNSRLITQDNSGLLSARRAGIAAACGDYIISLDSDDCLRFDALELIEKRINQTGADVVYYSYSRLPDFSRPVLPVLDVSRVYNNREARLEFCSTNRLNSMWSKAISRSSIGQEIDYSCYGRLNMGEDALQSLAVFDVAQPIACLDAALYYYRDNPASISSRVGLSYIEDIGVVHDELFRYAKKWDEEAGNNECTSAAAFRCIGEIVHFALHYPAGLSYSEARIGLSKAEHSVAMAHFAHILNRGTIPYYVRFVVAALEKGHLSIVWLLAQVRRILAFIGDE